MRLSKPEYLLGMAHQWPLFQIKNGTYILQNVIEMMHHVQLLLQTVFVQNNNGWSS